MNIIVRFFLNCSGANLTILKECPTETNKYVGIGATVFFTGVFAFISGAYALYTIFQSVIASVLFGVVWGSMIFNLDRYIVSSMKKIGNFRKEFQMAFPRLLLAILLAIVISKPLELKIFEPEIGSELILMSQQLLKEQEDNVKIRFQPQMDLVQEEIDKLKKEIKAKTKTRDELLLAAQQEADGTGGTGKASLGPIYKIKRDAANNAGEELKELIAINTPIIDSKLKEIDALNKKMMLSLKTLEREQHSGLAARLNALHNISDKSEAIKYANWFIVLLFLAIETAPLFVKVISGKGPYDDLLRVHEHTFSVYNIQQIAKLDYQTQQRVQNLSSNRHADNDSLRVINNE